MIWEMLGPSERRILFARRPWRGKNRHSGGSPIEDSPLYPIMQQWIICACLRNPSCPPESCTGGEAKMADSGDSRKKRRLFLDGRSVATMVTIVRLALRAENGPRRMPFPNHHVPRPQYTADHARPQEGLRGDHLQWGLNDSRGLRTCGHRLDWR